MLSEVTRVPAGYTRASRLANSSCGGPSSPRPYCSTAAMRSSDAEMIGMGHGPLALSIAHERIAVTRSIDGSTYRATPFCRLASSTGVFTLRSSLRAPTCSTELRGREEPGAPPLLSYLEQYALGSPSEVPRLPTMLPASTRLPRGLTRALDESRMASRTNKNKTKNKN